MASADDGIAPTLRECIQFLQQPRSYPEQPDSVQIIQTHISVVALAGSYAYKLKKPVNFDFLDFSTLSNRRYYCKKEIELNRRLCSSIYLGILPIYQNEAGLHFGKQFLHTLSDQKADALETPVEYVVTMKRLDDAHFLRHKVRHGSLNRQDIQRTAQKLARFYRGQEGSPRIRKWGYLDTIRKNIEENFNQTKEFVDSLIRTTSHSVIHYFTKEFISRHASLFSKRVENDAIVDGHGDLHLDHIHATKNRICIYDCIEFNDRFRYQDIANDIAFLAMDLDRYEKFDLSQQFITWMAEELDDQNLNRLIDFYKCYRAVVRGKVEAFKTREEEISDIERQKARKRASRYFQLALRYAVIGSNPLALVIMGRIGTGKSTLSRALARALDLHRYNSDRIRKELAGLPIREPSPRAVHDYLYSQEMSDRTYTALMDRSLQRLREGHSVILDATFSRRNKRWQLLHRLNRDSIPCYFIEMQSKDHKIKKRLKKRENLNQIISDARLENFESLNKIYQPPREISDSHLLHMNTEQSVQESVKRLFKKLVDIHVEHS